MKADKLEILESYTIQYTDPIVLYPGDEVIPGQEETEEKWKGWIWVQSNKQKGWVPIQILNISSDRKKALVTEYYSAQELEVNKGELVSVMKTLNGWSWVKSKSNEEGWIPNEIIKSSL